MPAATASTSSPASAQAASAARALATLTSPGSGHPVGTTTPPSGPWTTKSEREVPSRTSDTDQSAAPPWVENVWTGSSVSCASRRPCSSSMLIRAVRARSGVNRDALAR